MRVPHRRTLQPWFPTLICVVLWAGFPQTGFTEVVIIPQEKWSNVFADQKVTLHFVVKVSELFEGRVLWTFASANGTIFQGGRGEVAINVKEGKSVEVKIPLQFPSVKAGVVLAGVLKVEAVQKGEEKPQGTFERKLWIFFDDPFANRTEWLKKLEIAVFDPTAEAKTVKLLEKLKIPHEVIRNLSALEELNKGMLLIGEGTSFRDERGLDEIILKLAKSGLPVLCLAPGDGLISLPGAEESGPLPNQVCWKKQNVITKLDKHLDSESWAGTKSVVASSLIMKAEEGKVVGEVVTGPKGWPCLEAEYTGKGKLVLVGFPVIGQWESSPTPRYLFARLLEYVTESSQEPK